LNAEEKQRLMKQAEHRERLDSLDTSIFDLIPTQTTKADRHSLLAVQHLVAKHFGSYTYLEIGSHLGGSIVPHLVDARCSKIYSIDLRPESQPDNDGRVYQYPGNTSRRMLPNLSAIDAAQVAKVVTFDLDARDVDPNQIDDPPQLCFVDGEHTTEACFSDGLFCIGVCSTHATLMFHDANHVVHAISRLIARLGASGKGFRALVLPEKLFVIALDGSPAAADDHLCSIQKNIARFHVMSRLRHFYRTSLNDFGIDWLRPVLENFWKRS
jgi:hypothetical protein